MNNALPKGLTGLRSLSDLTGYSPPLSPVHSRSVQDTICHGIFSFLLAMMVPESARAQAGAAMDVATLERRSLDMIEAGTPERAHKAALLIVQAKREELRKTLPPLDEAGRLDFMRRLRPYDIAASVGAGRAVAQGALLAKGVVLESLIEDRRAARLLGKDVASLRDLTDPGERTFSWRFLTINVDEVLAKMPREMALIELVHYRRHARGEPVADWYGAAILRPGVEPVFVPAGPAKVIDAEVRDYRSAIEAVAEGVIDDQVVEGSSRRLHDWLAAKWYPHLKGVQQIVICPDGILNFIPFSTLLDGPLLNGKGKLLAEKGTIYYASSGRDLVAKSLAEVVPEAPVIFAVSEFGGSGKEAGPETAGLAAIEFGALIGTREEAEKVAHLLSDVRRKNKPPIVRLEREVTEAALRNLKSPEILHLATHGFFLEEVKGEKMSLSGLALSKAQGTVERLRRGIKPDPDNDDILFAEEAGELDLRGTELVTLSACQTAVGVIEPGEGVMGLRRALVQAGARNVLMTLWNIADGGPTVEFMETFYQHYLKTGNAPLALSEVQREILTRLQQREYGLAEAIYLAGGFVLSAQATRTADPFADGTTADLAVLKVKLEENRKLREETARNATMAFHKAQEFSNTLGMTFITVDGTRVLWCEHETRVSDYAAYATGSPGVNLEWKDYEHKGHMQTPDHPVINVTWGDAMAFCAWLSQKEGRTYRLPTDHEWSIAVGIGNLEDAKLSPQEKNSKVSGYPWGQEWPPPTGYGNFSGSESAAFEAKIVRDEKFERRYARGYTDQHPFTAPVKCYQSTNGLFDLSGNVKEWCQDWYNSVQSERILRGGCWYDDLDSTLRSSFRYHITPSYRNKGVGFRVVCELGAKSE